ncbi:MULTISPECIES: flavodoxin family protein [unclassified Methanoregula]|uniref:flavodoxin family protein n=1 Tax=unclassified Methanoregula TaxID=2649730 RepID=UPI0009CA44DE|nr:MULTISPECIES: flavodoxin family protein [unclassified Methanoregula]OPX64303.1 MAG: Iron-sulfur flavoprotein [Methanoregula sp. PtaB.Bin085]OPY33572.1 MAG: Iron-sulfur flavoprotein [Methanoregula sp. PtaU1.Bin006]
MKKATILIGSPRKNGSTAILAAEAEKALKEQGVDVATIFLNDLKIKGCQACYWCKKNDVAECAVKDDMQKIHTLMKECDGMIVASPIYFGGVTAQAKAWLDRMFPYIGMDLTPKMPAGKKVSFIFTQNQPDARLFRPGIDSFMFAVGLSGLLVKEYMVGYDLDAGNKPAVETKKEFMDRAYLIGRELLR